MQLEGEPVGVLAGGKFVLLQRGGREGPEQRRETGLDGGDPFLDEVSADDPGASTAEVRGAVNAQRISAPTAGHRLWGVVANLALAAGWLLVQPLTTHGRHHDWVILIGTYFSSFVFADVTTTNLLGVDHVRVLTRLSDGVSLWRVLLAKNMALITLVGLPTLAAAMALTVWMETPARLAVTVPNVAVPILTWLGLAT